MTSKSCAFSLRALRFGQALPAWDDPPGVALDVQWVAGLAAWRHVGPRSLFHLTERVPQKSPGLLRRGTLFGTSSRSSAYVWQ